jgi:hypothetical protein
MPQKVKKIISLMRIYGAKKYKLTDYRHRYTFVKKKDSPKAVFYVLSVQSIYGLSKAIAVAISAAEGSSLSMISDFNG